MTETRLRGSGLARRDLLLGAAGMLAVQGCRSVSSDSRPPRPAATSGSRSRVNLDGFVQDCVVAGQQDDAQAAVKEVLARGVSDPGAMLAAVGEPTSAGINVLHRSPTLTVFAANWTPQMNLMPHNHLMWALIGIFTGREDNIFWKRENGAVKAYTAEALFEGDVGVLSETAIHSVTNPLERFTGGIHIYGGDFFATTRSQWDPETLEEQPSDGDVIRAIFKRANERMQRMS